MDDNVNGFFVKASFIIIMAWIILAVIKAIGIGAVETSWWVVGFYPAILIVIIAAILGGLYGLAELTAWLCKKR